MTQIEESLDLKIIRDAKLFFENNQKIELSYNVKNTNRTLGARLASEIINKVDI